MEIGKPERIHEIEPIRDPFEQPHVTPEPAHQPEPVRTPTPVPEQVPA